MVKHTSFGFTIIEIMVVLSLAGILMIITFVGISSYRKGDAVTVAANEFVANLRSTQNKVDNGADGVSVKNVDLLVSGSSTKSYVITGKTIDIKEAWMSRYYTPGTPDTEYAGPLSLCFVNRFLGSFDSTTNWCGPDLAHACTAGSGYVCDRQPVAPQIIAPIQLVIRFSNGSVTRDVIIEGSGMRINNIYAK